MKNKLTEADLKRFTNYLRSQGGTILELTNEHEVIRFRGEKTGVLYTTGKAANLYTMEAIRCWKAGGPWSGKPQVTGRYKTYHRQKKSLLKRDGTRCFYCAQELGDDITVEHIKELNRGGNNRMENLVLAHKRCNNEVQSMTVAEKVQHAVQRQIMTFKMRSADTALAQIEDLMVCSECQEITCECIPCPECDGSGVVRITDTEPACCGKQRDDLCCGTPIPEEVEKPGPCEACNATGKVQELTFDPWPEPDEHCKSGRHYPFQNKKHQIQCKECGEILHK